MKTPSSKSKAFRILFQKAPELHPSQSSSDIQVYVPVMPGVGISANVNLKHLKRNWSTAQVVVGLPIQGLNVSFPVRKVIKPVESVVKKKYLVRETTNSTPLLLIISNYRGMVKEGNIFTIRRQGLFERGNAILNNSVNVYSLETLNAWMICFLLHFPI
jgi:hypothetical protein